MSKSYPNPSADFCFFTIIEVSVPSYLKFRYVSVLMLSSPKPCSFSFCLTCFSKIASLREASTTVS
ncbi:hypothetical protein PanWU01x14_206380 [Parasponia andersonii]|uniref:Uncharacterized protein n=1 Tax=Parasponia andersonii TaxID=3476 RepID=A0A2P5BVJ2_PARAD|nr:hypothetical protein PanWU01x14_206380 [Parasponia andersonii]